MPKTTIVHTLDGDKEVPLLAAGFAKASILNQNTGKLEHVYSRYEVVEGGLSLEEERKSHRDAILQAILKRADDFLPIKELDTD